MNKTFSKCPVFKKKLISVDCDSLTRDSTEDSFKNDKEWKKRTVYDFNDMYI